MHWTWTWPQYLRFLTLSSYYLYDTKTLFVHSNSPLKWRSRKIIFLKLIAYFLVRVIYSRLNNNVPCLQKQTLSEILLMQNFIQIIKIMKVIKIMWNQWETVRLLSECVFVRKFYSFANSVHIFDYKILALIIF